MMIFNQNKICLGIYHKHKALTLPSTRNILTDLKASPSLEYYPPMHLVVTNRNRVPVSYCVPRLPPTGVTEAFGRLVHTSHVALSYPERAFSLIPVGLPIPLSSPQASVNLTGTKFRLGGLSPYGAYIIPEGDNTVGRGIGDKSRAWRVSGIKGVSKTEFQPELRPVVSSPTGIIALKRVNNGKSEVLAKNQNPINNDQMNNHKMNKQLSYFLKNYTHNKIKNKTEQNLLSYPNPLQPYPPRGLGKEPELRPVVCSSRRGLSSLTALSNLSPLGYVRHPVPATIGVIKGPKGDYPYTPKGYSEAYGGNKATNHTPCEQGALGQRLSCKPHSVWARGQKQAAKINKKNYFFLQTILSKYIETSAKRGLAFNILSRSNTFYGYSQNPYKSGVNKEYFLLSNINNKSFLCYWLIPVVGLALITSRYSLSTSNVLVSYNLGTLSESYTPMSLSSEFPLRSSSYPQRGLQHYPPRGWWGKKGKSPCDVLALSTLENKGTIFRVNPVLIFNNLEGGFCPFYPIIRLLPPTALSNLSPLGYVRHAVSGVTTEAFGPKPIPLRGLGDNTVGELRTSIPLRGIAKPNKIQRGISRVNRLWDWSQKSLYFNQKTALLCSQTLLNNNINFINTSSGHFPHFASLLKLKLLKLNLTAKKSQKSIVDTFYRTSLKNNLIFYKDAFTFVNTTNKKVSYYSFLKTSKGLERVSNKINPLPSPDTPKGYSETDGVNLIRYTNLSPKASVVTPLGGYNRISKYSEANKGLANHIYMLKGEGKNGLFDLQADSPISKKKVQLKRLAKAQGNTNNSIQNKSISGRNVSKKFIRNFFTSIIRTPYNKLTSHLILNDTAPSKLPATFCLSLSSPAAACMLRAEGLCCNPPRGLQQGNNFVQNFLLEPTIKRDALHYLTGKTSLLRLQSRSPHQGLPSYLSGANNLSYLQNNTVVPYYKIQISKGRAPLGVYPPSPKGYGDNKNNRLTINPSGLYMNSWSTGELKTIPSKRESDAFFQYINKKIQKFIVNSHSKDSINEKQLEGLKVSYVLSPYGDAYRNPVAVSSAYANKHKVVIAKKIKNFYNTCSLNSVSVLFKHHKMFKKKNKSWLKKLSIIGVRLGRERAFSNINKIKQIIKTRLYLQKKRKAKKQRLETRRQKKRTRLFPRPTWVRFRMFSNFLNKRNIREKALSYPEGFCLSVALDESYKPLMLMKKLRTSFLKGTQRLSSKLQSKIPPSPNPFGVITGYGANNSVQKSFINYWLKNKNVSLKDTKFKANIVNFKAQKQNNPPNQNENNSLKTILRDFWVWFYNTTANIKYNGHLSTLGGVRSWLLADYNNPTLWALNKTFNKYSFTPYNKRFNLWGLQKQRNQSKNNKTIKITKQLSFFKDRFFMDKNLNIFNKKIYSKMRTSLQKLNYLNSLQGIKEVKNLLKNPLHPVYTKDLRGVNARYVVTNRIRYTPLGYRDTISNSKVSQAFKFSINKYNLIESSPWWTDLQIKQKAPDAIEASNSSAFSLSLRALRDREKANSFFTLKGLGDGYKHLNYKLHPFIICSAIIFHFCAIISLISISQMRCFIKFHLILVYKLSNIYSSIITKINSLISYKLLTPISLKQNRKDFYLFNTPAAWSRSNSHTVQKLSSPSQGINNFKDKTIVSLKSSPRGDSKLSFLFKKQFIKFYQPPFKIQNKSERQQSRYGASMYVALLQNQIESYRSQGSATPPEGGVAYNNGLFSKQKRFILAQALRKKKAIVTASPRGIRLPKPNAKLKAIQNLTFFTSKKNVSYYVKNIKLLVKKESNKIKIFTKNAVFKTLFNIIDLFQYTLKSIYAFFEKPAEFATTWIAYGFLVEWSSDVLALIPENMDIYVWNTFSKISRPLSICSLNSKLYTNLTLSGIHAVIIPDGNYASPVGAWYGALEEKDKGLGLNIGFANPLRGLGKLTSTFSLLSISFLLQRRITYFFDFLVKTVSQPDSDLMRRQQKGTLFWDIWADFLVTAADQYNVNIAALSTIKAEQNSLIDNISNSVNSSYPYLSSGVTKGRGGLLRTSSFKTLPSSLRGKQGKYRTESHKTLISQMWSQLMPLWNQQGFQAPTELGSSPSDFSNLSPLGYVRPPVSGIKAFSNPVELRREKSAGNNFNQFKQNKDTLSLFNGLISWNDLALQNRWSVNQFITYQSWHNNSDLFIDYHPPKTFTHLPNIKYNNMLQQPIGILVCQIYSGIFNKQISKNILLVNNKNIKGITSSSPTGTPAGSIIRLPSTAPSNPQKGVRVTEAFGPNTNPYRNHVPVTEGQRGLVSIGENKRASFSNSISSYGSTSPLSSRESEDFKSGGKFATHPSGGVGEATIKTDYNALLIQALAGETELKIITDNAKRYALVNRGFAIGIKLLRDVFDKIKFNTPCIFLLEDIDAIGERRPMLISDYSGDDNTNNSDLFMNQRDEIHEKNQVIYQNFFHAVTHYKKPFKGDYSLAIPTNKYLTDLYKYIRVQSTNNYSLTVNTNSTIKPVIAEKSSASPIDPVEPTNETRAHLSNKKSFATHLQITQQQSQLTPPNTSPFSVLLLKDSSKITDVQFQNKVVGEFPWVGLPGEQLSTKPRVSYSIRAKVAMLAELSLSNLSAKLDMITDLLVIIDSVRGNRGFVVFATTNVPHVLDPALRRPGRLDETICMPTITNSTGLNPNLNSEILKIMGYKNLTINLNDFTLTEKLNNALISKSNLLLNKFNKVVYPVALQPELRPVGFSPILTNPQRGLVTKGQGDLYYRRIGESYVPSPDTRIGDNKDSPNKFNVKELNKLKSIVYYEVGKYILNFKMQHTNIGLTNINYLAMYGDYVHLIQELLILFGGKMGQFLSSASSLRLPSLGFGTPRKGVTYGKRGKQQNSDLNSNDLESATSLMKTFIQKRYLSHKNLIVPKLLSFVEGTVLDEPPSPPFSSLLIPAKRFENYKRVFRDSIFSDNMGVYTNLKAFDYYEKIQYHLQLSSIKKLKAGNLHKNFVSSATPLPTGTPNPRTGVTGSIIGSEQEATPLSDGGNLSSVKIQISKLYNLKSLQTTTNTNWYYQNRILKRHSNYLTNQWWNGQLSEHNAESVFLSDIDWRSSFIKTSKTYENKKQNTNKNNLPLNISDVLLDFPDADQYYNPRRRRWLLQKGYWSFWFNYDQIYNEQILYHLVFESLNKTYAYLYNNSELLDYLTSKFISLGYQLHISTQGFQALTQQQGKAFKSIYSIPNSIKEIQVTYSFKKF